MRNKRLIILKKYCDMYSLPFEVCCGIYTLETTYRPIFARMIENILVLIGLSISLLFGKSIRNYTIGCMQIGLATILTYSGYNTYEHYEKINDVSFSQARSLVRAMFPRRNIEIACLKIKNYYNYSYVSNDKNSIVHIGELYNGQYTYGLKLLAIVEENLTKR